MSATKHTPGPITGPYHGPSIADQLRLIGSLCGTDHPTGKAEQRAAIAYVSVVTAEMLEFIDQMARFTTPEDEFADDPQCYEDADEMVAGMDDERLCGEYATFMEMIRKARKVAAKARGEG